MPVMDGLTAAARIRNLDRPAADVPIIAVTANVLPHQVKLFGEARMNDHVARPLRKGELLETVTACLRRSGATVPSTDPAAQPARPEHVELALELLGVEKFADATRELRRRIKLTFATPAEPCDANEARRAHNLISLSSMPGFPDLAEACIGLEQACRSGARLCAAFDAAQRTADVTIAQIASRGRLVPAAPCAARVAPAFAEANELTPETRRLT